MNKTQNYKRTRHICKVFALGILVLSVVGCSEETPLAPLAPQPGGADETVAKVPITISLGGYGEDDPTDAATTRTAPPGAGTTTPSGGNTSEDNGYEETKSINTVRIIAFKRKTETNSDRTSTIANQADDEDFVYDPKNDMTLTELTDEDGHQDDYLGGTSHKHRVAKGTFAKSYGYEYRIVALAYDSEETVPYPCLTNNKVIADGMKLNLAEGTEFKDFNASFINFPVDKDTKDQRGSWQSYLTGGGNFTHNIEYISPQLVTIPQLFYGTIYCKDDASKNPIISYGKYDKDNNYVTSTPLVGTLYRGMAEIVLNIQKVERVSNHNPSWICLLADNVFQGVKLTNYDDFNSGYNLVEEGKYTAIGYHITGVGESTTIKAYVLPGKARLGIRLAGVLNGGLTYIAYNGQIQVKNVTSADNATGVISVDAINNVFYLRRNHKYVLNCATSSTIMANEIK